MIRIPAAMANYRQFITYTTAPSATRPGKVDKFPVDWRTGKVANAHARDIWLDADTALALGAPVGFVFTESDPFWFLDIDECLDPVTGQWSALAQQMVAAFPGAAVEVSQSGRGLHIFGSGKVPPHSSKPRGPNREAGKGLELYHAGRFVALTGTSLQGDAATDHTPALAWLVSTYFPPDQAAELEGWRDGPVPEWSGPTGDDELIARMLRHTSAASAFGGTRASFRDLWECNEAALARAFPDAARAFDASSADAALASHLAYYTGNDHERMLRLMQRSGLVREKWEQRPDYLRGTITYSAARTTRWLADKPALIPGGAFAPTTDVQAAPAAGGSFLAAAGGAIAATLVNVQAALRSAEGGVRLAFDAFKDRIVIGEGTTWRAFADVDYVTLRTMFEEKGFKPISGDLMRDAVLRVALGNTIDTAKVWAESLVWDGVPRIAGAMPRYFGTKPGAYSEAVGRYLFTALAGRVMDPGCQADMALILCGQQGQGKTSAVRALAPTLDTFAEVSLDKLDDDVSRKLRGKLVCELAELRGLRGRDAESIRAWITRRVEEWRPKYREFETTFARRCVLIGTSNPRDVLADPEGHRRFLPIDAGAVDLEALERDVSQLWAEGVAVWRAEGVAWQEAQRLARAEHGDFEVVDEVTDAVAGWLEKPPIAGPGEVPSPHPVGVVGFSMLDLARGALGLGTDRLTIGEQRRIGAILRRLGYVSRQTWRNGRNLKLWHRASAAPG